MAKRYPGDSLLCLIVILLSLLLWVLLGCHVHYHAAQQGPDYHFFGAYSGCPEEQADELERDPRWDALEDADAATDADG